MVIVSPIITIEIVIGYGLTHNVIKNKNKCHIGQGDLKMGYQDVVFLPSEASFSTKFLKNYGRC